jgi:FkbM family methyltransferase
LVFVCGADAKQAGRRTFSELQSREIRFVLFPTRCEIASLALNLAGLLCPHYPKRMGSQFVAGLSRSSSRVAQGIFNVRQNLDSRRSSGSSVLLRTLAKLGYRGLLPAWNIVRKGKWVRGHVYGRDLVMPAEHPVLPTVASFPLFNRPLGLAVAALPRTERLLSIIDVGANIGETVAVIEEMNPDKCMFLCIEPEHELAEFCRRNYATNQRVLIREAFIGEQRDGTVMVEDDGRANPATKICNDPSGQKLRTLDDVVSDFVDRHGVDLIKTDTEGFDLTILRSAELVLRKHMPALYFEWYPELLRKVDDCPGGIFQFLRQFGYRHWVFFTARGELHCELTEPTDRALAVLANVASSRPDITYFDVFSSPNETVTHALTDSYLRFSKR